MSDDLIAFLGARLDEDECETIAADLAGSWFDAPLPRRWHRCRTVQSGRISTGAFYERCACGSIRRNGGPWTERNSRRKEHG